MEFLIHVIDKSSQHKENKESKSFEVVEGESEKGELGEVVESDSFYLVEDKSPIDAVVALANIIRIKSADDELVLLSEVLAKSNQEFQNASIEDDNFIPLKTSNLNTINNNKSQLISSTCNVMRRNEEEEWVEFHEIFFYVMPRKEILFIKG